MLGCGSLLHCVCIYQNSFIENLCLLTHILHNFAGLDIKIYSNIVTNLFTNGTSKSLVSIPLLSVMFPVKYITRFYPAAVKRNVYIIHLISSYLNTFHLK